jgi:hypothetical protein
MWRSLRAPKVLFWIDTLCIPVGENYHHLKMRAINSMAKTYANAQAIIILDHELQQTKHLNMPFSQTKGLLACSTWMSRCWTFQEGALAKQWLVQFEDGIWSPDGGHGDTSRDVVLFLDVPRPNMGGPRIYNELFGTRSYFFRQVWNNLCTRSTTKREDLVSIIAILLGFRPAEIVRLSAESRLLSLICAQDVLPMSLIYRERAALEDWSEACQWLPSTIEEVPIDIDRGVMWRRSRLENFFILKFPPPSSSSNDQKTRLYFTQTTDELSSSVLRLIDEDTHEDIKIEFLLSRNLTLPQLNICIILSRGRPQSEPIRSGACLGVRYREAGLVQLYYLCPVKCVISSWGHPGEEITQTNLMTRVKQEDLSNATEFAIEHSMDLPSRVPSMY